MDIKTTVAKDLLSIGAVFLRPDEPFTWASGIKSPIYCDNRLILTAPEARVHVESAIAETVRREYPEADFLKLLVLDATTGQNALNQARVFDEAVELDGIVLTKLDGTAKGGFVFSLAQELGLPVIFAGVGEKMEDLEPFDSKTFVEAIL